MSKILIVDDSKMARKAFIKSISTLNHDVVEATNGEEGLAMARSVKPDLIILDVTMPVMDGAELLSQLKRDEELKSVPVIMLTANSSEEDVRRYKEIGAVDFLGKVFQNDLVPQKVTHYLTHPNG